MQRGGGDSSFKTQNAPILQIKVGNSGGSVRFMESSVRSDMGARAALGLDTPGRSGASCRAQTAHGKGSGFSGWKFGPNHTQLETLQLQTTTAMFLT